MQRNSYEIDEDIWLHLTRQIDEDVRNGWTHQEALIAALQALSGIQDDQERWMACGRR